MLNVTVEEKGRCILVTMEAPAEGFLELFDDGGGLHEEPIHPFMKYAHQQMRVYQGDAELAIGDFELGEDTVTCAVWVADNEVTRACVKALENECRDIETGCVPKDWYISGLIMTLQNLWD